MVSENLRRTLTGLLIISFVGWILVSPFPAQAEGNDRDAGDHHEPAGFKADDHETAAVEKSAETKAQVRKKHFPWLGAILGVALVGGLVYYFLILKTTLQVNTEPAGARIYADGKDSGQVSPCLLKLSVGAHTLKAVLEGYADSELEVVVKNGKNSIDIPLDIGTFAIASPAANACVQRETACLINWDSTAMARPAVLHAARSAQAVTQVDLELYQNEDKVSTIARGVPNSGTYNWNVPATSSEGHNCKIRISCSEAPVASTFGPGFNLLGFKEDFTDNRADFWLTDPNSDWTAAGGQYTAANQGQGFSLAIYDFFYGESAYTVESRMRWSETSGGQNGGTLFIMLGSSNSFTNNSGYALGYSLEGMVSVFRSDNFDFQSAQSGQLTTLYSGSSGAVNQGFNNWNTVKVVRNGSRYALFINGTLVHTLIDSTYNPTHVMIGFGGTGARTVVDFDHVHVTINPES